MFPHDMSVLFKNKYTFASPAKHQKYRAAESLLIVHSAQKKFIKCWYAQ